MVVLTHASAGNSNGTSISELEDMHDEQSWPGFMMMMTYLYMVASSILLACKGDCRIVHSHTFLLHAMNFSISIPVCWFKFIL